MSVPMDIEAVAKEDDPHDFDDVPRVMRPMLFPMKAEVSAIGVEYGLYQGRFWLPRLQVAEGGGQIGFVRVPFKLEQKVRVRARQRRRAAEADPRGGTTRCAGGTASRSASDRGAIAPHGIQARAARREARNRCDSTGVRTHVRNRDDGRIPCSSRFPATP
jgi:hypothetical protein